MTKIGEYILNNIPQIKEKIEIINDLKLDFKTFNEYRIILMQIEKFNLIDNLSDKLFVKKINEFVFKINEQLKTIIEKNNNLLNIKTNNLTNQETIFFILLSKISFLKEQIKNNNLENINKEDLNNLCLEIKQEIKKDNLNKKEYEEILFFIENLINEREKTLWN